MRIISRPSVENRRVSLLFGNVKSFFGPFSCLLFVRRAECPSVSSSHKKKNRGREQVELLLHVTPYLLFDDGIWVGTNKNTSAMATDGNEMSCICGNQWVHWILFVSSRSLKASTLPCSLMTSIDWSLTSVSVLPSGKSSCINSCFFGEFRTCLCQVTN